MTDTLEFKSAGLRRRRPRSSPPAVTSPAGATASPSAPQPNEGEALSSRAATFLARIDAHLPKLAGDHERRLFLEGQLMFWERAYERFLATEGESMPGAYMADFTSLLAGIGKRLAQLRRAR